MNKKVFLFFGTIFMVTNIVFFLFGILFPLLISTDELSLPVIVFIMSLTMFALSYMGFFIYKKVDQRGEKKNEKTEKENHFSNESRSY